MADDVTIGIPAGTKVIAADDISSKWFQRVKLALGADGTGVDAGAGAGAVGTDTQRVTLGSDDPAVASLGVIDDWDESDRAKVNIIVGQAGVAAGAGAVGATVQRVTHASDDPVTTAVQLIDDAIFADDAAFTPGTSKIMVVGFQADETAADSVNEGDAGAARMTLDRKIHVAAELETAKIRLAGAAATPLFAKIVASSSGVTEVIAAVASNKIRVLELHLTTNGAVNVKFQSHTIPTDLTGLFYCGANAQVHLPFNPLGHFETISGEALDISLSGAVAVGGYLVYVPVP